MGSCALREPAIAQTVEEALLHRDSESYRLLGWCVMPNHVHVVAEIALGSPLADILRRWKSFSARRANEVLGRSGQFWQEEYFDRYIRSERHFAAVLDYVEANPVKAGLMTRAEDWPFSSARFRVGGGAGAPPSGSVSFVGIST